MSCVYYNYEHYLTMQLQILLKIVAFGNFFFKSYNFMDLILVWYLLTACNDSLADSYNEYKNSCRVKFPYKLPCL